MTEVNLNETVNGYRGSIGRLVFKRYKGRTIVGRKPVVTKAPTDGQIAHRERFKAAVAFAKSAVADPVLSAFYGPIAQERDVTVYVVAVGDFLKKPEFKYVDLDKYLGRVGDEIVIKAVDDIGLAYVDVKLVSQQGTVIESGSAIETGASSGLWKYIATAPVALGSDIFVEVTGADHAGNKIKISENPTVGEVE
jgi:hypothetical protein